MRSQLVEIQRDLLRPLARHYGQWPERLAVNKHLTMRSPCSYSSDDRDCPDTREKINRRPILWLESLRRLITKAEIMHASLELDEFLCVEIFLVHAAINEKGSGQQRRA